MTVRGRSKRISPVHDVYPTPRWAVDRFLDEWPVITQNREMHWLEAGAGDGAIVHAVNEWRRRRKLVPILWTVCEIRELCAPTLHHLSDDVRILDFANAPLDSLTIGEDYDAAIFNPPFTLTMQFLRRCLAMCEHVAMLQRQNFIGSAERNDELRANMPDQWMIPDRVDFAGDGSGDAIGHSWWTWDTTVTKKVGELHLLKTTPLDIRKSHRPRRSLKRAVPTKEVKKRRRKKKPVSPPPVPVKMYKKRRRKKKK